MFGFIDESMRQGSTGLYVVALVVVEEEHLEQARRVAMGVLLPRQKRFHWKVESEPQRLRMLEQLRAAPVSMRAYACRAVPAAKQERARARCMNRMLWDLRELCDVEQLVIESRHQASDRRDQRTIAQAQRATAAPAELRYDFQQPDEECLLWLPDALAGAVATELTDGPGRGYLGALGGAVTVVDVGP